MGTLDADLEVEFLELVLWEFNGCEKLWSGRHDIRTNLRTQRVPAAWCQRRIDLAAFLGRAGI